MTAPTPPPQLQLNLQLLEQARGLLEKLDDAGYRSTVPAVKSEGIGVHMRHCLDFYLCLLKDAPRGRVDYDGRARDERLEAERAHALAKIERIETELRALAASKLPEELWIRQDTPGGTPDRDAWTCSSLERELQFLAAHTVHHFALIAMIVRLRGGELDADFGIAPSTLQYWKEPGARAR